MRKICLILLGIIFFCGTEAAYSQFIQNSSRSLFSDVKAFRAGDALMVLIMEDTQADNAASTQEGRSTDISAGAGINIGSGRNEVSSQLSTGNNFKGGGKTSRSERIRSRLSVRVVEVVENGNLKIEGTRSTKINGETQTVIIEGIVRPVDILPNNSVYSYSILDLSLTIEGEGTITDTHQPGLITRFLRFLF